MAEVIPVLLGHPLIGRWRANEDDARSEYDVSVTSSGLDVRGVDFLDGEEYEISNISWLADRVEFDTHMPSTGRSGHVKLHLQDNRVLMQFTFTDVCEAEKR